jgi:hypothetical protein
MEGRAMCGAKIQDSFCMGFFFDLKWAAYILKYSFHHGGFYEKVIEHRSCSNDVERINCIG